jgi:4-hydroxybenzoate polyprenyltransferase
MRPTQWLKNGILMAALVFAGEATNPDKVQLAVCALIIYCLLSGQISLAVAVTLAVALGALGIAGAWLVNWPFFMVALVFLALNLLYTLWLKHIVIVDVMSIAVSFVLRAYAGALAIEVPASKWMLINTLLLALFLGFGKRRHELLLLEDDATSHRRILDRYSPYLLDQLIGVVTASVVVMYMLYTFSSEVMQKLGTENLFVTIPFVIYGVFRYLYLIHKEEKGGSPTRVMIGDAPILINVILWLITAIVVLYLL